MSNDKTSSLSLYKMDSNIFESENFYIFPYVISSGFHPLQMSTSSSFQEKDIICNGWMPYAEED